MYGLSGSVSERASTFSGGTVATGNVPSVTGTSRGGGIRACGRGSGAHWGGSGTLSPPGAGRSNITRCHGPRKSAARGPGKRDLSVD
jgi:hypothetical protein